MKYYLIAGEKSGDLHASNLMKAIRKRDDSAEFRFFGGDEMKAVGGEMFRHYADMAIMGFLEVVLKFRTVKENMRITKQDVLDYKPDVLILVDYGGFNMRIAEFAKNNGIKVFYYIVPKVWAWNQKRALKLKRDVDELFCVLPFEKEFFRKFETKVNYVGNPVLDAVEAFVPNKAFLSDVKLSDQKPLFALLPGSRRAEIERMLPVMLDVMDYFPQYQPVIAGVNQFDTEFYNLYLKGRDIPIVYDQTYDLLHHSEIAIVTSGTATLETALFRVPQVVCFATSPVTYFIAKSMIKVKYISLVNLIAAKELITELIQNEFSKDSLKIEIDKLLPGSPNRTRILEEYEEMHRLLGSGGASKATAELMVNYLNA